MASEFELQKQARRAERAKQIIEDEIFVEAFNTLEQSYIAAWRATAVDEMIGREKLFLAINIVGKVRQHFEQTINDGKVADADLRELARAPKPRWQEVK